MSDEVDQLWAWLSPPLRELQQMYASEPAAPWAVLRAQLLERLGLSAPEEHPVTQALFAWLDELGDEDRGAVLQSDGLDAKAYAIVQQVAASLAAEGPAADSFGYDEEVWNAFLAENLPRWDGSEPAWEPFREWFVGYADQVGVGEPAAALVNSLDPLPVTERIAVCAQYGVSIVVTPADEGSEQDELIDGLVAANPQFAAIPAERRRQLLAEIMREQSASVP